MLLEWPDANASTHDFGPISGKEYWWFGATLRLSETDRASLQGALRLERVSAHLNISLLIKQIGERAVGRWGLIDGLGLPAIGIKEGDNNPYFLQDGLYAGTADGTNVNVNDVVIGIQNFLRNRFKFVGVVRERPSQVPLEELWNRSPILPLETETAIVTRSQQFLPGPTRDWYRSRDELSPTVGVFDVRGGTVVFETKLGDDQIPMPLQFKGGGHQIYMHLTEQLRDTGGHVVAIEEPENHLHANLIKQFANELQLRSKDDGQFFVSTHSPHMVNTNDLSSIWFVRKESAETAVKRVTGDDEWKERLSEIGILPSDFLFAAAALIVERVSDKKILTRVAHLVDDRFDQAGIVLIDAKGDSKQRPHFKFWCEITQNAPIPVFSVLDKSSECYKEVLLEGGMEKENIKVWELGDIEDYYPRKLILDWIHSKNATWTEGLTEEQIPEGETVQKLRESLPGDDWWKAPLAEYVAEHITKDDVARRASRPRRLPL